METRRGWSQRSIQSRVVAVAVLIALSGTSAAGCGSGGTSGTTGGANPPPPTDPCAGGTVSFSVVSGDSQVGTVGTALANRVVAQLNCTPTSGSSFALTQASVTWSVVTGGGSIAGDGSTGLTGQAGASWTLGTTVGTQTARVAYGTTTLTFTATGQPVPAVDVCEASGGTTLPDTMITTPTTWDLAHSPYRVTYLEVRDAGVLTIEAGVTVCAHQVTIRDTGRLVVNGTSGSPVTFTPSNRATMGSQGMVFLATTFSPSAPSELHHVRVENALAVAVSDDYPVTITGSWFGKTTGYGGCSEFAVTSTSLRGTPAFPTTISSTVFDGMGCAGSSPAVAIHVVEPSLSGPMQLGARVIHSAEDGIAIGTASPATPSVLIHDCEVTGSGRHGIYVGTGGEPEATITGCNLFDNVGNGVQNDATTAVVATGNWWGSPAGPAGAGGDGVGGNVDAGGPLGAPVVLSY
jgi:hypothetical protein